MGLDLPFLLLLGLSVPDSCLAIPYNKVCDCIQLPLAPNVLQEAH